MKSNIYKKLTFEDKFVRHWCCKGARLRSIRFDKRFNHRKMRRLGKEEIAKQEKENEK